MSANHTQILRAIRQRVYDSSPEDIKQIEETRSQLALVLMGVNPRVAMLAIQWCATQTMISVEQELKNAKG